MMDMRFRILFVLICRFQIIDTAIEPGCKNCGCCVDKECATEYIQGQWVKDYCTQGCNIGFGGIHCNGKCANDCKICEQFTIKRCATCEIGKYLSTEKRCEDCPATCTTCSLRTDCQTCKAPYYNQGEITNCSLLRPANCVQSSSGNCSACQDGYFNVHEVCRNTCQTKCKSCLSLSICQTCNDGYFNGKDSLTKYEVTNCSLNCRDTCVNCSSYDACTFCKQGHYGSYCQDNCSVGCTNGECDANDGSCVCIDGFTGIHCTECAAEKDTSSIVGVAVGISSAIVLVMMIILISTFFLILKRWKRYYQQGQVTHASYVNAEFQPTSPDTQSNIHTQQEYVELRAINERDDTCYEQLNAATLQDSK